MTTDEIKALADELQQAMAFWRLKRRKWATYEMSAASANSLDEELNRAAAALRQLAEERDREERLLSIGGRLEVVGDEGGTPCYCWTVPPEDCLGIENSRETQTMHPDRAESARLAEEKSK